MKFPLDKLTKGAKNNGENNLTQDCAANLEMAYMSRIYCSTYV